MKKYLLILTAFLSVTAVHGQTNVYHPFPEDSAIWIVDYTSNSCQGYCNSAYYEMNGDTIINTVSYNKIYTRSNIYFYYTGTFWAYNSFSTCHYMGAVRQDSINKKVYYRASSMTSDTLLYNFNLHIGDTLPVLYTIGDPSHSLVVTGIDSTLINGNYHKVFFLNGWNFLCNWSLIEGVGWSGDFLGIRIAADGSPGLDCFKNKINDDGTSHTQCDVPLACSILLNVNEQDERKYFNISPNPFSFSTTLRADNPFHNATLSVDNCFGQTVAQIKNISGQTVTLYRDNLPSGLYFVRLTEENKTIAIDKLVITDK